MKKVVLLYLLMLLLLSSEAQEKVQSLHLKDASFKEFVDSIEKKVNYKIYYSDVWVDSLSLSVDASNAKLEEILTRTLADSGFTFIVSDDNKIILSKGYTIKTDFKEEYEKYLVDNMSKIDSNIYILPSNNIEEEKQINDEFRVFKIGNPSDIKRVGTVALSGYIKEAGTNLPIIGAVVYVEKLKVGATSNIDGFYSLSLPRGQHIVEYRTIGMRTTRRNLIIYSAGSFNIEMLEKVNQLDEVTITADRENKVQNLRMGTEKLSIKMLKQIPMGMGEVDVVKSSLLLPGVQTVGEAAGGYNVRGGSTDQNLMLLNDAPIINPSHFFGFFSAFNSDVIGDVTLYKSGVPAKYGGRISSVMDIELKEGTREKFKASGGISPVTARLMVEGPAGDKASYILSGRTTYSNWIMKQLSDKQLQQSTASFYDIQGMTNIDIDKNNKLSISGYYSKDKFNYYLQSAFDYSNLAATVKWNHTFKPNLYADFSGILSNYNYQISGIQDSTAMNSMFYRLNQYIARADFTYFPAERHKVNFGLNANYYWLAPGELIPLNDSSQIMPLKLQDERSLETSIYVSDDFEISPLVTISGGLRFNMYASFGPYTDYEYSGNSPLSPESIIDTSYYSSGQFRAFYPNLEFRVSSRFLIGGGFSLKAGYQRMFQYIHMISNTTAISPTDIWKLSNKYIKPQRSDQFSLGVYRNFKKNTIETSVEAYYKFLDNIIDYKGGAQLLMNEYLETELINGTGKAYGVEFMVKKTTGSITGWISYTYSRILHKVDGPYAEEKINGGDYFPANYDKPHDLKVVVNSKLSRRFNVTANFVYNTGRPITYPVGYYNFREVDQIFYSNRNEFRIPDYIRLDLAATLNGNLKARKLNHSSLTLAVYNVFGRRNPYSIFFKLEDGQVNGYKMSIFGQPIITLTYNFKILGNASDDF